MSIYQPVRQLARRVRRLLSEVARRPNLLAVVGLCLIVAVAFQRPLTGQGTFVGADIALTQSPWNADVSPSFRAQNWIVGDTVDSHLSRTKFAAEVRGGELHQWNRQLSGGIPQQSHRLSPFDIAYVLLPEFYAPGVGAALRALTALLLMFGFLRAIGLARLASFTGAVAYGFSGYFAAWTNWNHAHVAVFIPGLFWAGEAIVRRSSIRTVPFLSLGVAAMLLARFPAVYLYAVFSLAAYLVARSVQLGYLRRPRRLLRPMALVAAGFALGVALAAIHVVPFAELLDNTDLGYRGQQASAHLPARYLLTLFNPTAFGRHYRDVPWFDDAGNWVEAQAYVGLAVLCLVPASVLLLRRREGREGQTRAGLVVFFVALAAFWIAAVFGGGVVTRFAHNLPGLSTNFVGRARIMATFATVVLAALGMHALLERPRGDQRRSREVAIVAGAGAALLLGVLALIGREELAGYVTEVRTRGLGDRMLELATLPMLAGTITLAAILASLLRPAWTRVLMATISATVVAELLVFFMPVNPVVPRDQYFPTTPAHEFLQRELGFYRMAGRGWTFLPNTALRYGLADVRGHTFHPDGWQGLLRAVDPKVFGGGSPTNAFFTGRTDPADPILDLMATRYWAEDLRSPVLGAARTVGEAHIGESEIAPGRPLGRRLELLDAESTLRSVAVRVAGRTGDEAARIRVSVLDGSGRRVESIRRVWDAHPGRWLSFPLVEAEVSRLAPLYVELSVIGDARIQLFNDDAAQPQLRVTPGADDGLRLVFNDGVVLYERTRVQPPVWFTSMVVSQNTISASEARRHFARAPDTAIVQATPLAPTDGSTHVSATGEVEILSWEDESLRLAVDADGPGIVVVSQSSYPGWKASVDGEHVPLLEAFGAIQAIPVEAGQHDVTLNFQSAAFRTGTRVSAAALVVLSALLVAPALSRHRRRSLRDNRRTGEVSPPLIDARIS